MTNLLVQRRKQAPSRASKSRYPQPPAPVGSVPGTNAPYVQLLACKKK